MNEIWKPIPKWETLYHASDKGRIKRLARISDNPLPCGIIRKMHLPERILSTCFHKHTGYFITTFSVQGKETKVYVHRVICETFNGAPEEGHEVRHLDGNKTNNLPENLLWGTSSENTQDMISHGTIARGNSHGRSKLTEKDTLQIRKMLQEKQSNASIARLFGVDPSTISNIKRGRNWSWLG